MTETPLPAGPSYFEFPAHRLAAPPQRVNPERKPQQATPAK